MPLCIQHRVRSFEKSFIIHELCLISLTFNKKYSDAVTGIVHVTSNIWSNELNNDKTCLRSFRICTQAGLYNSRTAENRERLEFLGLENRGTELYM